MDRTEGKPVQMLHVQQEKRPTPDEAMDAVVRFFNAHPDMLENTHMQILLLREARSSPPLRARLTPLLKQHNPDLLKAIEPVDTTLAPVPSKQQ